MLLLKKENSSSVVNEAKMLRKIVVFCKEKHLFDNLESGGRIYGRVG